MKRSYTLLVAAILGLLVVTISFAQSSNSHNYLPVVAKSPPPTPTVTPFPNDIYNISFVPPSPATLYNLQPVNITFTYSTSSSGVRVWAIGYSNGAQAGAYTGSYVEPGPGTNVVTRAITNFSGTLTIDQVQFLMRDEATQQTLVEFFVPVQYTFIPQQLVP